MRPRGKGNWKPQLTRCTVSIDGKSTLDSSTSTSESPPEGAQPKHEGRQDVNQSVLATYSEKFQHLTRWDTFTECIVGCGAAGAISLLVTNSVVFWVRSTAIAIFLLWPFLIVFGFVAGAIIGLLASLIILPINASLGRPLKSLWFSFVVGGLSGFFPFLLVSIASHGQTNSDCIFWAAIGPFPQMVLGHLWAYFLTEKAVNDHNERFGVVKYEISQTGIRSSRFGITHIMILTAWAALGFSLLSCFPPEFRSQLAKLYLPLQVAAGVVAIIVIGLVFHLRRYRKRNVSVSDH